VASTLIPQMLQERASSRRFFFQ